MRRVVAALAAVTAAYAVLPLVAPRAADAGDVPGHVRDMYRSFALALGPLFVRLVYVPLWAILGVDQRAAMGPAFWLGWGLPLLAYEVGRRR